MIEILADTLIVKQYFGKPYRVFLETAIDAINSLVENAQPIYRNVLRKTNETLNPA